MFGTTPEEQKLMDELLRQVEKAAPPRPVTESKRLPYLTSIIFVLIVSVVGVVLVLWLRPDIDPIVVMVSIPAIVTPTMVSLMALMEAQETKMQAREANEQARETHIMVNSRLKLWMDAAQKIAFAEGEKMGRESADQRTDLLSAATKDVPLKE